MAIDLRQTDTGAGCGAIAACSGATLAAAAVGRQASPGGTAGSAETTVELPTNTTRAVSMYEWTPAENVAWEAGTWTIRVNATTGHMNVLVTAIHVCRLNSSCGVVESLGSATGLSHVTTGGTFISQNVEVAGVASPGSGDKVYIVIVATNDDTMNARAIGITPDSEILTSFTEPAGITMAADPGSYSVTGTAASLLVGAVMLASPGSYAVAGSAADTVVTAAIEMAADPGTYAVTGSAADTSTAVAGVRAYRNIDAGGADVSMGASLETLGTSSDLWLMRRIRGSELKDIPSGQFFLLRLGDTGTSISTGLRLAVRVDPDGAGTDSRLVAVVRADNDASQSGTVDFDPSAFAADEELVLYVDIRNDPHGADFILFREDGTQLATLSLNTFASEPVLQGAALGRLTINNTHEPTLFIATVVDAMAAGTGALSGDDRFSDPKDQGSLVVYYGFPEGSEASPHGNSVGGAPSLTFRGTLDENYEFVAGEWGAEGPAAIAADPGAYAVDGSDAGTLHSRLQSADPGSYGIAGQAVGTLRSYLLAADPGSYAVTGSNADTLATPTLVLRGETGTDPGTFEGWEFIYDILATAASRTLTVRLVNDPAGARTVVAEWVEDPVPETLTTRTRALTTTQAEALDLEDWGLVALFHDPDVRLVDAALETPVALAAVELAADPGTYTVTGAAAGTLRSLVMGADAGSYAAAGSEAETLAGRTMAADPGSYEVTGTDAGELRAHVQAAEPGAYAVTGASASTTTTGVFELLAGPGTYAVTGSDAATLRTRIFGADPGTYEVTGADAGTLRSHLLTADPGAYSVTGEAAATLRSHVMAAEAGSYAVSGEAAGTLRSHLQSADPGSYEIDGADAATPRTRVMAAEAGAYEVTGADASTAALAVSTIGADPGAYHVTGADAATLRSRLFAADPGSYAVTGADADTTVFRAFKVDADPGLYEVTGSEADTDVVRKLELAADPGSYAVQGAPAGTLRSHVMGAEPGAYATSGSDAETVRGRSVLADPGSYEIAGSDAALTLTHVMGADPGAYVITGSDADTQFESGAIDLCLPYTAAWIDPARTASWIDPERTATLIDPERDAEWSC